MLPTSVEVMNLNAVYLHLLSLEGQSDLTVKIFRPIINDVKKSNVYLRLVTSRR